MLLLNACANRNVATLTVLLKNKAVPYLVDRDGRTALDVATNPRVGNLERSKQDEDDDVLRSSIVGTGIPNPRSVPAPLSLS